MNDLDLEEFLANMTVDDGIELEEATGLRIGELFLNPAGPPLKALKLIQVIQQRKAGNRAFTEDAAGRQLLTSFIEGISTPDEDSPKDATADVMTLSG